MVIFKDLEKVVTIAQNFSSTWST